MEMSYSDDVCSLDDKHRLRGRKQQIIQVLELRGVEKTEKRWLPQGKESKRGEI